MDKEAVRGALQHYFDHSAPDEDIAHEIYHEDAVLEFRGDKVSRESACSTEAWEDSGMAGPVAGRASA